MPASCTWFNIATVIFSRLLISWYENKLRIWAHKASRRANNDDIGLSSLFWFDRMSVETQMKSILRLSLSYVR